MIAKAQYVEANEKPKRKRIVPKTIMSAGFFGYFARSSIPMLLVSPESYVSRILLIFFFSLSLPLPLSISIVRECMRVCVLACVR